MSVWSVRTKLLSTRLLCYKRSMAKWFRRKGKAPSDSESTGKIGQAKDPKSAALQPSYTDDFGQAAPPPPAPTPLPAPQSPGRSQTHHEPAEAQRLQQPAQRDAGEETGPASRKPRPEVN